MPAAPPGNEAAIELGVLRGGGDEAKAGSGGGHRRAVTRPSPVAAPTGTASGGQEEPRRVHIWNGVYQPIVVNGKPKTFPLNRISTTKYTWYNFIFLNLFQQLMRPANLYFCFVAVLQSIGVFSISEGRPTILLPLIVVLFISGLKDAVEDYKRHAADRIENESEYDVYDAQEHKFVRKMCAQIAVGDIVRVKDDESFPADLLLICSLGSEDSGFCYVETANLDGETNLKLKAAPEVLKHVRTKQEVSNLRAKLQCEAPSGKLDQFGGSLQVNPSAANPNEKLDCVVGLDNLLLRGSGLRNSGQIWGIAVYTGEETKIRKNTTEKARAKVKRSHVERIMNKLIYSMFALQASLCLIMAIAHGVWESNNTAARFYVDIPDDAALTAFTRFFTWFIIYNSFVPISLLVSLEVVKLCQGMFIGWDRQMSLRMPTGQNQFARAQTTGLNENLGQIEYVLSDKTGTLTENSMDFRKLVVQAIQYGEGETDISRAAKKKRRLERRRMLRRQRSLGASGAAAASAPAPAGGRNRLDSMPPPPDDFDDDFKEDPMEDPDWYESEVTALNWELQRIDAEDLDSGEDELPLEGGDAQGSSSGARRREPERIGRPGDARLRVAGGDHGSDDDEDERKDGHQAARGRGTHRRVAPAAEFAPHVNFTDRNRMHAILRLEPLPEDRRLFPSYASLRLHAEQIHDFLSALALCNTVYPTREMPSEQRRMMPSALHAAPAQNSLVYKSNSPDETALVEFAAFMGYELNERNPPKVRLRISAPRPGAAARDGGGEGRAEKSGGRGKKRRQANASAPLMVQYEQLALLDFSPKRKRMTVVLRTESNRILVLCKGADSSVSPLCEEQRLPEDPVWELTERRMERLGEEGLRTLMVARAELPASWWDGTAAGHRKEKKRGKKAAASAAAVAVAEDVAGDADGPAEGLGWGAFWNMKRREFAIESPAEMGHFKGQCSQACRRCRLEAQIERAAGLSVLGATAIEDKLQEAVPATISAMLAASINVWILTGDKLETAINIGMACNLLTPSMVRDGRLFRVQAATPEAVKLELLAIKERLQAAGLLASDAELGFTGAEARLEGMPPGGSPGTVAVLDRLLRARRQEIQLQHARRQHSGAGPTTARPIKPYSSPDSDIGGRGGRPGDSSASASGWGSLAEAPSVHELHDADGMAAPKPLGQVGHPEELVAPGAGPQGAAGAGGAGGVGAGGGSGGPEEDHHFGLVLSSSAFTAITSQPSSELLLLWLWLTTFCASVVGCRMQPDQKAKIARTVRQWLGVRCLCVGDGANDELMILEADVGVGIRGVEGTSAVRASDYAISQFRFLQRLLLVHGRLNYERIVTLICYIFYKNSIMCFVCLWYSFFSGFSGQVFLLEWSLQLYNVVYTALPILVFAVFDYDLHPDLLVPRVYRLSQSDQKFNFAVFWRWILASFLQSIVLFFIPVFMWSGSVLSNSSDGRVDTDIWSTGVVVYTGLVITVNLKLALIFRSWTWVHHLSLWGSIFMYLLSLVVLSSSQSFAVSGGDYYYVMMRLLATPKFYFVIAITVITALLPDFVMLTMHQLNLSFFPRPASGGQLIRKRSALKRKSRERFLVPLQQLQ